MKNRFYRIICAALAALFFYGCPMEEPPDGGENEGLDPRLPGVWRFSFDGSYEQCVITTQPRNGTNAFGDPNLGTLVFGAKGWGDFSTYHDSFGGDIVYAKSFRTSLNDDKSAGIIIIEYWPGLENKWPYWNEDETPYYWAEDGYRYPDRNYYGIYYINLFADGHQVFLACTNDQSTNYGPTETRTLREAIDKFAKLENLPKLLNLDVGDPHTRYNGPLDDGYSGPPP